MARAKTISDVLYNVRRRAKRRVASNEKKIAKTTDARLIKKLENENKQLQEQIKDTYSGRGKKASKETIQKTKELAKNVKPMDSKSRKRRDEITKAKIRRDSGKSSKDILNDPKARKDYLKAKALFSTTSDIWNAPDATGKSGSADPLARLAEYYEIEDYDDLVEAIEQLYSFDDLIESIEAMDDLTEEEKYFRIQQYADYIKRGSTEGTKFVNDLRLENKGVEVTRSTRK